MPAVVDRSPFSGTDQGAHRVGHRPLRPNSYRLTHPKNYVGVPLAIATSSPAEVLVEEYLVKMAGAAKIGARALGYLTPRDRLTPAGQELVATATDAYGSPEAALTELASDDVRYGQFDDTAPALARAGRRPLQDHPGVQLIVEVLDEHGPLSLPELTVACVKRAPDQTSGFLLVDDDDLLDAVVGASIADPPTTLETTDAYPSETTYQFKSILAHFGIVATPGADSATLEPTADTWAFGPTASEVSR